MTMKSIRVFAAAHKVLVSVVVIALVGGGYWYYKTKSAVVAPPTYTLAPVEKGTLITTVSGSGQVSASDQLDVKAKASGQVMFVGTAEGKAVKKGDVLIRLDDTDARKAVRDAQTALDSAKLSLEKLQQSADSLSLVQAENAVSQAARNEQQAEITLDQYKLSSAQTVATAYENGYTDVSNAYLDMPNHMKDLKDLRGTDASADANVGSFKIILGDNSPLIVNWLHDHDAALAAYNDSFTYFKTIPRSADNATRYDLITRTLVTENLVSQALQSAHALLDAAVNTAYKQYSIATTVDTYRPKILADISQINSDLSGAQQSIDTIDSNNRDYPINLKKDQDAITAAQESLAVSTDSLAKLKAGADPLDVKAQQISIQQRQNALNDAYSTLSNYVVTAPFDGTVAVLTLKRGDEMSSGGVVATLVTPNRYADITLNELDVVKTKAGQKATLTFDAVSGLSITGEVADVDLLGTVSQGVVNYGVRIVFDTQDDRVRPSMSVTANIMTQVKTDVLTVPGSAVKSQNGASYVEMFDGHQSAGETSVMSATPPRRQTVEVGLSNDSQTEIVSGLKEGDIIVIKTATPSATAAKAATSTGIPGLGGSSSVRIPGVSGGGGSRGN